MAKTVRDFDEEKIRDCKEDIDTLLVFVSFIISADVDVLIFMTAKGRSILCRPHRISHRVIP